MKTTFSILVGVLLLSVVGLFLFDSNAQGNDDANLAEQAQKALSTVQKLVNGQNAATYGLKDARQLADYKPAKAIMLTMLPLDAIKSYQNGTEVKSKLMPLTNKRIVPLLTKENQLSGLAIELEKRDGKWTLGSFGRGLTSTTFQEAVRTRPGNPTPVWIPALNVEALQFTDDKGISSFELVSTPPDERMTAAKGKRLNSNDFFNLLKPLAIAYNGLPW